MNTNENPNVPTAPSEIIGMQQMSPDEKQPKQRIVQFICLLEIFLCCSCGVFCWILDNGAGKAIWQITASIICAVVGVVVYVIAEISYRIASKKRIAKIAPSPILIKIKRCLMSACIIEYFVTAIFLCGRDKIVGDDHLICCWSFFIVFAVLFIDALHESGKSVFCSQSVICGIVTIVLVVYFNAESPLLLAGIASALALIVSTVLYIAMRKKRAAMQTCAKRSAKFSFVLSIVVLSISLLAFGGLHTASTTLIEQRTEQVCDQLKGRIYVNEFMGAYEAYIFDDDANHKFVYWYDTTNQPEEVYSDRTPYISFEWYGWGQAFFSIYEIVFDDGEIVGLRSDTVEYSYVEVSD